jgi:hypothetical protein
LLDEMVNSGALCWQMGPAKVINGAFGKWDGRCFLRESTEQRQHHRFRGKRFIMEDEIGTKALYLHLCASAPLMLA